MVVQSYYDYKEHRLVLVDEAGRQSFVSNATLAAIYEDGQWVGDQVKPMADAITPPKMAEINPCDTCEHQNQTKWCNACVKYSLLKPRLMQQRKADQFNALMQKARRNHGR